MRYALYLRVSTSDQAEQGVSLQAQETACRAWVQARGSEIAIVYRESGSAGDANRPQYRHLLEDIREGLIDGVVVSKIDRLSRSVRDFQELVELCEYHGVAIVATTQQIDTSTPAGRLLRTMIAAFAEFEREMISERTREGMMEAAKHGRYCGGRTPYGYRIAPAGGLEPDPSTAPYVLEIFRLYTEELHSADRVVTVLRQRGVLVTKKQVLGILRNPVYMGFQRWAGEVHDGDHEPIVDEGRFREAGEILARHARPSPAAPRKKRVPYLYIFDGLVRCGICGRPMVASSVRRGDKTYPYYRCNGRMGANGCPARSINAAALDRFICAQVHALVADDAEVEALVCEIAADRTRLKRDLAAAVKPLRKQRAEAERKVQNLLALASEGGVSAANRATWNAELERWAALRADVDDQIEAHLRDLKGQSEGEALDRAAMDEIVKTTRAALADDASPARRDYFRAMVRSAVLHEDRLCLFLWVAPAHFAQGPELAPLRGPYAKRAWVVRRGRGGIVSRGAGALHG